MPMTRPTRNKRTGGFLVRVAIPSELRDTTERLFGVRAEFRENLKTKDHAQAKERAPEAVARIQAKLSRARREVAEAPPEPSAKEVAALAGEWYRRQCSTFGDDPGGPEGWDLYLELLGDRLEDVSPDWQPSMGRRVILQDQDEAEAAQLLKEHGFATDTRTVRRLGEALVSAKALFAGEMLKRAHGDWSPDPNMGTFPELPARSKEPDHTPAQANQPGCTFDELLLGWARDRGLRPDAKPIPRAVYDRHRTLERLAAFLGHRDAARVTKADAVRWKEAAQARGNKPATVRNDVSEMSALWAWGGRNAKLATSGNPFSGILPPKPPGPARAVRAFTDDEAARILRQARTERGFLRWLPWVLCLTGARLNEVCQASQEDIFLQHGVNVIRIHDEGEGRSVKNHDSRRIVPLHPALLAEGFLDYVAGLPPGAALWPDVKPDSVFGQRSVTAGRRVSRWLKQRLGITDPRISPNHSWRHWFIGTCRALAMPLEVRSAITGHSARMDESSAYGPGMGTFVEVVASYLARVPCPVEPPQGADPGNLAANPTGRR